MEKSKNSINVEVGFLFCGGWNFSKSVSVGPTFIREMRVHYHIFAPQHVTIVGTLFEVWPLAREELVARSLCQ